MTKEELKAKYPLGTKIQTKIQLKYSGDAVVVGYTGNMTNQVLIVEYGSGDLVKVHPDHAIIVPKKFKHTFYLPFEVVTNSEFSDKIAQWKIQNAISNKLQAIKAEEGTDIRSFFSEIETQEI